MQVIWLISIIMAAYNAEKTIEQAINSVLNQTYPTLSCLLLMTARQIKLQHWLKRLRKKTIGFD